MPQETRLKRRDFTNKEFKSLIDCGTLNGHGPADSPFLLWILKTTQPEWLEDASAHHHDFYFILGGNETDRWNADHKYYLMMLQDANKGQPNDLIYFWRWLRCYVHFKAVRYGGRKSGRFYYGPYRTKQEVMDLRNKV